MTETPSSPARLMELFAKRAASGDLDGVMELYEPGAIFEDDSGKLHAGKAEVEQALAPLVGMKPKISFEGDAKVVTVSDIALVSNVWSLNATAPDGSDVSVGGVSADVLRRQADGSWLVLIDQPRGTPKGQ